MSERTAEMNTAIDAMLDSFYTQDDAYIGPFWYDTINKEIYGQVLTLASDRPYYYSKNWNKEVRTSNALHQSIWKKEAARGKDKRFTGNYTLRPRGRVFEFKNEGFKVCVGNWINDYPEAKEQIIEMFNLPKNNTEFLIDKHWDIGHEWSDEF